MAMDLNEQLGTTAVQWNLHDLFAGIDDPLLPGFLQDCEDEASSINGQYAGKVAGLNADELLALVTRMEALSSRLGRVATLAVLNFSTQTQAPQAGAFLQKVRELSSKVGKDLVFFRLEWARVPGERAAKLLTSPVLAQYQHHLEEIRRYQPHMLSEIEEALLLERAPVGRGSWTILFDKVLGHLKFGAKGRTEEEVLSDLYLPDRESRAQAARDLTAGLQGQLHILTHIFNTLLADKMIDDRLRHFGGWLRSMNLDNELSDRTVEALVNAVVSRYDIPQRYYRLKKRLLGLDELKDYDRYGPLPHLPSTTVAWPECREMVLGAFVDFSPEMAQTARLFFDRGWIHAPVLPGKRSGAFAHPCVPEVHPYVLVNYTGNLRDVSTVAHELGHGVHQFLAAAGGYYHSQTPLVLAETASVFAELLVFTSQLERLTDPLERGAFICQKLESIFATVFRQVAMNRFEDRVHNARRQGRELSSEEISESWLMTQRQMLGDSVTLTDDYGIWWSYIPHFLNTPGYVYSYAFGELLVLSLYRLYQSGDRDAFVAMYLELLRAGGSKSPYELLRGFGSDLDDPEFWHGGLRIMDEMLAWVE